MTQLLRPGESGLFIFTKGDCLEINKKDGSGYTGWWEINVLRRVDWIFIYYKSDEGPNNLYMARCGNLRGPNKDGRYRINLRDAKLVGCTDTNWVEFGGGAGGGLRYISLRELMICSFKLNGWANRDVP
jgi:hypothetical protein